MNQIRALHVVAGMAAILVSGTPAAADQIKVLSSLGIKAVVEELAPRFEKASGHKVTTVFGLASALKTSIEGGESFDVAILTPPLIDDLVAKGKMTASSKTVVARVGLALMVKAGARKPDVSSVDAFKKSLLGAKAITYAQAGASGIAFLATVEKLGIADAIKAKSKPAASGDEVNANVLNGTADFAVLPVSEILPVRGAELGGLFPAEVQTYIVMAAGANASAKGAAARDFISFLMSAESTPVVRAKGMER
jgi:molybdate transport system substrate-binding protein